MHNLKTKKGKKTKAVFCSYQNPSTSPLRKESKKEQIQMCNSVSWFSQRS